MRTGKHQFNYQAYAIKWAINIMANKNGYSVNRAYQIDRVFGTLVEQWLNYYQTQLEQVKRFSVISGAYTSMIRDFNEFGNILSGFIDWFNEKIPDYKTFASNVSSTVAATLSGMISDSNTINTLSALVAQIAITAAYNDIIAKIENISLARLNCFPKELQGDVKELHNQGIMLAHSLLDKHNAIMKDLQEWNNHIRSGWATDEEYATYLNLPKAYADAYRTYMTEQIVTYADVYNTLQNKYKRYLLDD